MEGKKGAEERREKGKEDTTKSKTRGYVIRVGGSSEVSKKARLKLLKSLEKKKAANESPHTN